MCAYRVMSHELVGDLFRERRLEATTNIDCGQFLMLSLVVGFQVFTFTIKIGKFRICL